MLPIRNLRVVVADDEGPARRFLAAMLRDLPAVEVVGEAATGTDALRFVEEFKPDVLLLDWHMPDIDGAGVVARLPTHARPAVVFVTAFDEYADQARDLDAVDYVLKPVDRVRLGEALARARLRAFASCL
jgi:two-component system LytT family response regulator